MDKSKLLRRVMPLVVLALLSAGCVTKSPPTVPPSEPARRPALPKEARQPPTPSICLPTCSDGLTLERESWRASLTKGAPPAQPASAPPTR